MGGSIHKRLRCVNIDGTKLTAVFGIRLSVKGDFLTIGQLFKALGLDSGEVNENIARSAVISNKAKALIIVKPFYSTSIHAVPPLEMLFKSKTKTTSQKSK